MAKKIANLQELQDKVQHSLGVTFLSFQIWGNENEPTNRCVPYKERAFNNIGVNVEHEEENRLINVDGISLAASYLRYGLLFIGNHTNDITDNVLYTTLAKSTEGKTIEQLIEGAVSYNPEHSGITLPYNSEFVNSVPRIAFSADSRNLTFVIDTSNLDYSSYIIRQGVYRDPEDTNNPMSVYLPSDTLKWQMIYIQDGDLYGAASLFGDSIISTNYSSTPSNVESYSWSRNKYGIFVYGSDVNWQVLNVDDNVGGIVSCPLNSSNDTVFATNNTADPPWQTALTPPMSNIGPYAITNYSTNKLININLAFRDFADGSVINNCTLTINVPSSITSAFIIGNKNIITASQYPVDGSDIILFGTTSGDDSPITNSQIKITNLIMKAVKDEDYVIDIMFNGSSEILSLSPALGGDFISTPPTISNSTEKGKIVNRTEAYANYTRFLSNVTINITGTTGNYKAEYILN